MEINNPFVFKTLFHAYIMARILYGLPVYLMAPVYLQEKLQITLNHAITSISRLMNISRGATMLEKYKVLKVIDLQSSIGNCDYKIVDKLIINKLNIIYIPVNVPKRN